VGKVLDNPHCQEEGQHLVDESYVDFFLLYLYDCDSLHRLGQLPQLRLQGA